ncbi:MAG: FAD-dependent oxidoreductase, partial [bacterium]
SAEHVTGFESQAETGEPLAPTKSQPGNQQAFTICFALENHESQEHVIEKPAEYEFWRNYVPALKPAWPGKLLSLTYINPITLQPRTLGFNPGKPDEPGWWKYRRIIDSNNFVSNTYPESGITLVNWPQNDYLLGNLAGPGVTSSSVEIHLKRARQLSLSLVYWLQTECPRSDDGKGWPGLKLRGDLLGTSDGLAKYPYVRESRRLKTKFTVTTAHVGTEDRRKALGNKAEVLRAEQFTDSVGIGAYRIDLHPSTGGDNYIDISSLPFQIPIGSLIPLRIKNLIPACKNLGVTHLTNGCYRLHPVEWAIGEAAGTLAAFSLNSNSEIQKVYESKNQQADYLKMLDSRGVRRVWKETKPL